MRNFGNAPHYRFEKRLPDPAPANETKEDRVRRLLRVMPPSVERNPALIPDFLAKAIAREDAAKSQTQH